MNGLQHLEILLTAISPDGPGVLNQIGGTGDRGGKTAEMVCQRAVLKKLSGKFIDHHMDRRFLTAGLTYVSEPGFQQTRYNFRIHAIPWMLDRSD